MRWPGFKLKALTLSYDDGVVFDKKLIEIMSKYALKGTFNLNGENFRPNWGLTEQEVNEYIIEKGHEIAIHGYSHRAPGGTRVVEGIKDVLDCRVELERKYNKIIKGVFDH